MEAGRRIARPTRKDHEVQFTEGKTVVHPHHGPATIKSIVTRKFRGTPTQYLCLEVHANRMSVSLPVDKAEEVGLREVLDAEGCQALFAVLSNSSDQQEEAWSRRFKANMERLRIGELSSTAEVVRDLTRRLDSVGLSQGEKDQLRHARGLIATEVALANSIDEEAAGELVDAVILGRETEPRFKLASSL